MVQLVELIPEAELCGHPGARRTRFAVVTRLGKCSAAVATFAAGSFPGDDRRQQPGRIPWAIPDELSW